MGDVGVVVEARGVVVHVQHQHRHRGRTGQAQRLSAVGCHHQQLVASPGLPVQEGAADDLPCSGVDGKLPISPCETVTNGHIKSHPLANLLNCIS